MEGITIGDIVCLWLGSGPTPAIVTRVNDANNTLSLTGFVVGDIVYKDNVAEYKFEAGDEEVDGIQVGHWTRWE